MEGDRVKRYLSVCSGIEVGQRFGRLVVTEIYSPKRRDQFRVKLICDCGGAVDTRGNRIKSDATLEEMRRVLSYMEGVL